MRKRTETVCIQKRKTSQNMYESRIGTKFCNYHLLLTSLCFVSSYFSYHQTLILPTITHPPPQHHSRWVTITGHITLHIYYNHTPQHITLSHSPSVPLAILQAKTSSPRAQWDLFDVRRPKGLTLGIYGGCYPKQEKLCLKWHRWWGGSGGHWKEGPKNGFIWPMTPKDETLPIS